MQENLNDNIIFGRNNIFEAISAGRPIEKIIVSQTAVKSIGKILAAAQNNRIPVVRLAPEAMDKKFAALGNFQGVVAYVSQKQYSNVDDILEIARKKNEKPFIVIADEIVDPHNLGAIIRSCECFGAHGVIVSKRRAAGLTASVEKAAGGALSFVPVARVSNIASTIDQLKKQNIWIFGCDMLGENTYYDENYDCALALVVGGEGKGISRLVKEKCDVLIRIPMHGRISCLNASVAAGVVLQEIAKKRSI